MNSTQSYKLSLLMRLLAIAISSVGMLLLLPFVLNRLGEYNFGIWGMVSSITSYLLLLDFGIALACTRYLSLQAEDRSNWTEIISNSLFLSLIIAGLLLLATSLLALATYLGVFTQIPPLISWVICIVMLEVALSIPLRMYLSILRAEVRYVDIGLFEVIRVACRIGGIGLALYLGAGLLDIIVLAAAVNVMFFVLPLLNSYQRHRTLFFSRAAIKRKTLWELLHFSKFTAVSQSAEFLKFRTDSVLVAVLIGITASAHYTIIVFIIMMVTQIIMRFMSYWDTIIIRHIGDGDLAQAQTIVLKSLGIGITLSMLAWVNLFIYGEFFIRLWVGEQYTFLQDSLLLLALILFSIAFQLATTPYFNGIKQEKTNASIDFSEVIAKLVLLLPLTTLFGFSGFIVTSLLTATAFGVGLRVVAFAHCSNQTLSSLLSRVMSIFHKPLALALLIILCHFSVENLSKLSTHTQLLFTGILQLIILTLAYGKAFKVCKPSTKHQQHTS